MIVARQRQIGWCHPQESVDIVRLGFRSKPLKLRALGSGEFLPKSDTSSGHYDPASLGYLVKWKLMFDHAPVLKLREAFIFRHSAQKTPLESIANALRPRDFVSRLGFDCS